jgi:hypothetical protein
VRNILIITPFLFACSEYELSKREQGDVFYQLDAGAVDILLVVDNSCSMQPYQEELASNFDAFLTYFIEGDVDYQIGVTTTTVVEVDAYPEFGCTQDMVDQIPSLGHLVNNSVLNADSSDAGSLFSELVNVGTCGAGTEMGLEAGLKVLQNADAGLLREDAYLSVIYVSDEQDASPLPVNQYINAMRAVKDPTARQVFNASSLVVTDIDQCNSSQINSGASEGSRYVDVADQADGVMVNICSDNFADIVTELSLNSSRLNDVFFLSNIPDINTLIVGVDDGESIETYPCDSEKYPWSYVEMDVGGTPEPAIRFDRSKLPSVNSKITAQYNNGNPGQEFSCGGEE